MIRPLTIQTKLLGIFLVAAALPLALVSLISYHNSIQAVEQMVGNRTERLARAVADDISRKLGRRLGDRILLVNEPVQNYLTAVNGRSVKAQFAAYRDLTLYSNSLFKEYSRYYREMILADGTGTPVFRFGRATGIEGVFREIEAATAVPAPPPAPADSVTVPEELPLPGLTEGVEEYRRLLKARLDASARDLEDVAALNEPRSEEEEKLPPEVTEALLQAMLQVESFEPRGGEPGSRRLQIISQPMQGGISHEDEQAARNGLLLPADVTQIFIHRDEAGDPESVRLVRPVFSTREADERLGVMLLDIRLDYLFPEDLAAERFGARGELAIVNARNGEVLFHSSPDVVGQDVRLMRPVVAQALQQKREGGVDASSWIELSDDTGRQLAALVDIGAESGWTVVATAYPREFADETRSAGLINLLVASVAILLALVVLIGSSRRISTSIHRVTEGAREIATGNLSHSIRITTHDEIQTLADTFNSMTASLRENISLREKAAAELEALNRTLEDRVQERTHELVALNEALNQANQELKELDRLKSNFLATVSHEFRTPLTSITAFSEILVDEMAEADVRDEVKRFLNIINNESARLGRLIKNLLDLSRIEAGRMRWDRAVFPIGEVLLAARDGLLPVFGEKRIRVVPEFDCAEARVNADRDRIQQVTTNLLENAVKFSERGHRIWIGCRKVPGDGNGRPFIQVTVRDEGPGIPREHLVRIFERFSQVDSTDTRGTGGSGLGLAISKEIVEHHGGRIWAESEQGKGASFHYTLPFLDAPSPPESGEPRGTVKEMKHG